MAGDATGRASARWAADVWAALLAGPVAASLQLSVNYALVKWACAHGGTWVLAVLTVIFLLLSLLGVVLGVSHLRRPAEEHERPQLWSADSRRLLAVTAIALDALVVVFLVNALIAITVLSPCE
jgi:hypothetical protein